MLEEFQNQGKDLLGGSFQRQVMEFGQPFLIHKSVLPDACITQWRKFNSKVWKPECESLHQLLLECQVFCIHTSYRHLTLPLSFHGAIDKQEDVRRTWFIGQQRIKLVRMTYWQRTRFAIVPPCQDLVLIRIIFFFMFTNFVLSCSVTSDSLWPYGL